jgi:hypothetical protein
MKTQEKFDKVIQDLETLKASIYYLKEKVYHAETAYLSLAAAIEGMKEEEAPAITPTATYEWRCGGVMDEEYYRIEGTTEYVVGRVWYCNIDYVWKYTCLDIDKNFTGSFTRKWDALTCVELLVKEKSL